MMWAIIQCWIMLGLPCSTIQSLISYMRDGLRRDHKTMRLDGVGEVREKLGSLVLLFLFSFLIVDFMSMPRGFRLKLGGRTM